ncbi:MAG: hypothetical protein N2578_05255, partial [Bdellovibrionaceae bacterium]|nr:hypothetical protein [Pseudobdellovibrionaceae bacterium]
MIFPWPDFRVMREAVITWTLLIANIMMFLLISEIKEPSLRGLKINQDSYTETSGRLFSQYWESLSTEEKSKRPDWIYRLDLSRQSHLEILGGYALRD